MQADSLRRQRRRLTCLIVVYFFVGAASQKLVPGVDEIFPFYGWSLFSKVPNRDSRYTVLLHAHEGRTLEPPIPFLHAPESMVVGNRFIGRKLIQRLGGAQDRGEAAEVETLRKLLEESYLLGEVRYELVFESYNPLQKWLTGENDEQRSLARFESAGP